MADYFGPSFRSIASRPRSSERAAAASSVPNTSAEKTGRRLVVCAMVLRIAHAGIQAERFGDTGNEIGCGDRIAAREQSHLVAEADKFFGQVGDDPLSTSVKPWGNAFDQGCNLSDFQLLSFHSSVNVAERPDHLRRS